MTMDNEAKCPYCGAVLRGAICDYCGSVIEGFTESQTYNEYRTKKAKSAKLSFFTTVFPLIFALGFGMVPFLVLSTGEIEIEFVLFSLIFGFVGLAAWCVVIYCVYKAAALALLGTEVVATVSGYSKSSYMINNCSVYSVKLLMNDEGEKYYIYLDTGDIEKRYVIGDRITVKKYKDFYKIVE